MALDAVPGATLAQAYPSKPIRVILPNPAAGCRVAATRSDHVRRARGNDHCRDRPGGGEMLGMEILAKSRPDGYTIGGSNPANLAAHPRLYDYPPFQVERDVAPVSLFFRHPWVLHGNAPVYRRARTNSSSRSRRQDGNRSPLQHLAWVTFSHVALILFQT